MLLDELVKAIEIIKARINKTRADTYESKLGDNEYRTRIVLIDPVLCALGWDVSDPALVTIEDHHSGVGTPDYALLGRDGKPKAYIEAKKLGETEGPPKRADMDQLRRYGDELNINYVGLTDGDHWIFRDFSRGFSSQESYPLDVTISKEPVSQCALKFLLLWQRNLEAGQLIGASEPILVTPPDPDSIPEKPDELQPVAPSNEGLVSLADFRFDRNNMPSRIHLPDGQVNPINAWIGIFKETAEYLIRKGKLTEAVCPIGAVVNTKPQSESGTEWRPEHTSRLSNGLFFNRNVGGSDQVKRAKSLLMRFGEDPGTILLKLSK